MKVQQLVEVNLILRYYEQDVMLCSSMAITTTQE